MRADVERKAGEIAELKKKVQKMEVELSESRTLDQKLRSLQTELESLKSSQGIDDTSVSSASRASGDVSNCEDIERLRKSLIESREAQRNLSSELASYKKNLFAAELEVERLQDEMEEARGLTGKSSSEQISTWKKEMNAMRLEHHEKIRERDAIIASLVNQSIA